MDGPSFVNQCPIPPNTTFTYDFSTTTQSGKFVSTGYSITQGVLTDPSTAFGITLIYLLSTVTASGVPSSYMVNYMGSSRGELAPD